MNGDSHSGQHPVVTGLLALVGVGLVVGLIAGLAALVGTRVLGLDGGSGGGGGNNGGATLVLPKPTIKDTDTGPQVTLAPGETPTSSASESAPSEPTSSATEQEKRISLQSATNSANPMEQIDLTGVYPGGEGAILRVQRLEDGSWQDFPVTASVSNQTFSTYVQTSRSGVNKFRVVDTDSGLKSNVVRVTIS